MTQARNLYIWVLLYVRGNQMVATICVLNGHSNASRHAKGLQTNVNFDTVLEKTKPESGNSGLRTINSLDSCDESGKNGTSYTPILPETPNLYKHNGVLMENLGYFIIPRSVTSDPRYKSARLKYQKVLHVLFENVAFAPTTHAIGVEVIPIAIGQFCVSVRGLMDLCNDGVKYKEDMVDKNIIERASHFWRRCGFMRQEVRHGKILITITVPDFYDRYKKKTETEPETKPRQNRDTKEEDKELKEDNIIFNAADASDSAIAPSEKKKVSSSSRKRKKVEPAPLIERDVGIFTSDLAHQKLIEHWKSEETVKQIYSAMAVWKAQRGIVSGDDYKTALGWHYTPKKPQSSYQKPQPKYNHDTSPRNPKNTISFAEEV